MKTLLLLLVTIAAQGAPVVTQMSAGNDFTCARFDNGRMKCWGDNGSGQLGLGIKEDRGKEPGSMGAGLPYVDLGEGVFVEEVSTGAAHTCVRLRGANPKCFGNSERAQLGYDIGPNVGIVPADMGAALREVPILDASPIEQLASGFYFTCARHKNGKVECWGSNWHGEVTNWSSMYDKDPTAETPLEKHGFANFGEGAMPEEIAAGSDFLCARFAKGEVRCLGANYAGQLGVGNAKNRTSNVSENVPLGSPAVALAAGQEHMCAILSGGNLKCWGSNYYGQLGQGDTQQRGILPDDLKDLAPIDLGVGLTVRAAAASYYRTCALLSNFAVKCWGYSLPAPGENLALGAKPLEMGDYLDYLSFGRRVRVHKIAVGHLHTCAQLDDGSLKCLGSNAEGQLGTGMAKDRTPRGATGDDEPSVLLF